MTSSNQNFENLRKVSSQFFFKVMWSKFRQNRPRIVEIRGCDRQTHTHILTHSPEMTEYKNKKTTKIMTHRYFQFCCSLIVLLRSFSVKCVKYAYIFVQQVIISQNSQFVIEYTSILLLTVFKPSSLN